MSHDRVVKALFCYANIRFLNNTDWQDETLMDMLHASEGDLLFEDLVKIERDAGRDLTLALPGPQLDWAAIDAPAAPR